MAGLVAGALRAQCRWAAARASGKVVGFSAATNAPLVQLAGGERVQAAVADDRQRLGLAFNQKVELEKDEEDGAVWQILPGVREEAKVVPMDWRDARGKYKQITRGPNAVGSYAWVSRKLRAGQVRDRNAKTKLAGLAAAGPSSA
eukprot:TRINITY_DN5046_c0_g1_i1.p2 TRINITY_DN5046_c0_g1~~TRINITY_DN5046_c0_g1_i1.p2  ORF type:complete len:157 (+),score=38.12 TRINITY_DN5046_c0_g1_i1:38-472(+)